MEKARILIVEDNGIVAEDIRIKLLRLGYEAVTVKDGGEAVKVFKKQKDSGEPFDAVILDITIKGGMGGEQTIGELLKIDPHIKGIVSSGYSSDPIMSDFEAYGFAHAMAKPYQIKHLKEVLEKVFK